MWAVEWSGHGVICGFITEDLQSEGEAAFRAYELARIEMQEKGR